MCVLLVVIIMEEIDYQRPKMGQYFVMDVRIMLDGCGLCTNMLIAWGINLYPYDLTYQRE